MDRGQFSVARWRCWAARRKRRPCGWFDNGVLTGRVHRQMESDDPVADTWQHPHRILQLAVHIEHVVSLRC